MSSDASESLISVTKTKEQTISPPPPDNKDEGVDPAVKPRASTADDRDPADAAAAAGP